jgi:hypothetical protein
MACACGTATNSAKLMMMAGIGATTTLMHPVFIAAAAGLIIYGLWRTAKPSGQLALAAFGVMAAAAVLTPPRVMSSKMMPWNEMQMIGGGLYLLAAALLGYAFWRAFPSPRPAASGTAIGGVALATGCTCCLVTGAVAGLGATGGASMMQSTPLLFWSGLAVAAAGLFRLGGLRAAALVPVGGLTIRYGPELLKLTGDWMVGTANMRSFGSYLITMIGAGIVLYGFVVAYRAARTEPVAAPSMPRMVPERELVGV